MYEVSVTREFSSAHSLRDYEGKCANLHGHNWKVEVVFRSTSLKKNGILIDFIDVGAILDGLLERLDHGNLNEIPPFDEINPTSENVARWLFDEISKQTRQGSPYPHRVRVWETPDAYASYWEGGE